jgi:hypothetical protein
MAAKPVVLAVKSDDATPFRETGYNTEDRSVLNF